MADRLAFLLRASAFAAACALAACGPSSEEAELANLDNQIVGNDADPALTSALEDQILVDPTLAQQSNRNAVRPPETPVRAPYPLPAGRAGAGSAAPAGRPTVAKAGAAGGLGAEAPAREGACGAALDYDPAWARRLPAAFALYPGARVTEAAGSDRGDCRVRVVTFTTEASAREVLGWYNARALRAGYSAEHQKRGADHVLGGTNPRDDGAFYLIVTPLKRGSDVALIANNGG